MVRSLDQAAVALDGSEEGDAEAAYLRLKQQIQLLELRPGTTVREADLQEQLGVRRTPLREALRRLVHDGMLQIYPRHGIVIATPGLVEIREMYEVRVALEATAAALAAQRRTPDELRELQRLHVEMAEGLASGDYPRWSMAHRPFHYLVVQCSRNRTLERYAQHHWVLNSWLWNIYEDARGERVASYSAHDGIVAAIAAGDAAAAEIAAREHIIEAKERLLAGL
jgi:DNA-binding GntR family transcriptional regulator